jgi:hypothetical protein
MGTTATEAAGRVQAWAVVFPRYDALLERAQREASAVTEDTARAWVMSDLRRLEQDIAPFKRMSGFMLADTPLPKTPLRKVRRFEVARMLAEGAVGFSADQLRASAAAIGAAASPAPTGTAG